MANALVRSFLEQLHGKYSADSLSMSMSDWVCKHTTLNGKPFSTEGYEFQKRILDDMHPNLWVIKISQVGLTEVSIRKMLGFLERNQGTTGIFTFPNQPMRDKNAKTRFKPIVDKDEVFNRERDKDSTRTATLYQLGLSFLHVTDCTEGSATSTPADALFTDEIDLSDQPMVALFQSRLENSDFKITQNFSTPTHVSFGVDAGFAASDQMEYLLRCTSCGHHNIPDFTREFVHLPGLPDDMACLSEIEQHHIDHLDLHGAYVKCERCHRPLDLKDPSLREWVAKYPTRTLARGYRVRPFSTSRRTIPRIIQSLLTYKKNNHIRGWWNTVIGKAYTAGNERLNPADIEACLDQARVPDISSDRPVAVGIDSGIMCHVVLFDALTGNPFSFEVIHSEKLVEYIEAICVRYNVVVGGMDRHPQTVLANQVHVASGGKIWPVEYRGTKTLNPVHDDMAEDGTKILTHFQADRTALLDRVAVRIRARNMRIAGYEAQKLTLITHLTNMVRDEKPEEPAKWLKLSEDDHYFHAMGMGLTGLKIGDFLLGLEDREERTTVGLIAAGDQKNSAPLLGNNRGQKYGVLG